MAEPLVVTAAEAGQKLLQYLQRRCGAPQSAIQRWVRTGQVRINGGRCKPFDRVAEGDVVRVPPFALDGGDEARRQGVPGAAGNARGGGDARPGSGGATGPVALPLPVVGRAEGLLVLLKPAGLAVQPGTGHDDCVTTRLAAACAGADFLPTPAHRLDRDTSGLLLVATTYARLRALSDAFAAREGLVKEYLAWVAGQWPGSGPETLHDRLEKRGAPGRAKVCRVGAAAPEAILPEVVRPEVVRPEAAGPDDTLPEAAPPGVATHTSGNDAGRHAACTVTPLRREAGATLLLVRLHTGRTHQIRVQLAGRGHAIMGDRKYGGPPCTQGMLLHAVRLTLPDGQRFTALPDWTGPWAVGDVLP